MVGRALSGWVLPLAVIAAGCTEDRLSLGAQCELNSDCESPLVCRLARCRVECRAHRDCPLGAVCLLDNEGNGSCRLPPESECTDHMDCPGDTTVCGGGACRNDCTDHMDCLEGRCEDLGGDLHACAEPTAADAGPPGDAGTYDPPRECGTDGDCGEGFRCGALLDAPRVCRRDCERDGDCTGDSICMQGEGSSLPGQCTHRCELGTQSGCPSGTACDFFHEDRSDGSKVFFTECRTADTGAVCDPCTVNEGTDCRPGLTCEAARCMQLCVEDDDCPEGQKCGRWIDPPIIIEGIEYGRCIDDVMPLCAADAGA